MSLDNVTPGNKAPDEFNVVIEIPKDSEPVKYEVDKESGAIFVDRILSTPMRYPCNYGYVPDTLCGDGDPADVLVVLPLPLIAGSVVTGTSAAAGEIGHVVIAHGGAPCPCGKTGCLETWLSAPSLRRRTADAPADAVLAAAGRVRIEDGATAERGHQGQTEQGGLVITELHV